MEIIIYSLIILLIEALVFDGFISKKNESKYKFLWIVIIHLFIIHAYVNVDSLPDLPTYVDAFDIFSTSSLKEGVFMNFVGFKMEPGWITLNFILSRISKDYLILMFFTSFVTVYSYIKAIKSYSPYIYISVVIFYCLFFIQSLFVLRQYMAMSLCLLSIPYIIERNFKKFFILLVLACTIHYSALVFGLLYPLYCMKINRNVMVFVFAACIIGRLISEIAFNFVFQFDWYSTSAFEEGSNITAFIISCIVVVPYFFVTRNKISTINGAEKLFFLMCICWLIIQIAGIGYAPTNRLAKYFSQAAVFLVPMTVYKITSNGLRNIVIAIYILMFTLMFNSDLVYIENLIYIF